jgi:O-antigen/teichoic acid export membrane protein
VAVGSIIADDVTADAVRLGLVAVPLSLFSGNVTGVLQGLRSGRRFNVLRTVTPAVFAVGLLLGVIVDIELSAIDILGIYVLANAVAVVVAVGTLRPEDRAHSLPPAPFVRHVVRYGAIVGAGSIAYTLNKQLALVVLAAVTTLSNVGLYAVALGYAAPVGIVAAAVALHTLPDIAAAQDTSLLAPLARRRIRASVIATIPLALVAIVAAPPVIPFAFGGAFEDSVPVAQALVVGQVLLGVAHVLSEISRGLGRPGLPALGEGIGAVATLAALPLIVPEFGIAGAAVASIGVYAGVLLILHIRLRGPLEGDG